jgi:hypothetical protein
MAATAIQATSVLCEELPMKLRNLGLLATVLTLIAAVGASYVGMKTMFNLYYLAILTGILTLLAWRDDQ